MQLLFSSITKYTMAVEHIVACKSMHVKELQSKEDRVADESMLFLTFLLQNHFVDKR